MIICIMLHFGNHAYKNEKLRGVIVHSSDSCTCISSSSSTAVVLHIVVAVALD